MNISLPATGRARRERSVGSEVRRERGDGQVQGEYLTGVVLRAEGSSSASGACAPREGLRRGECHPPRPPARGSPGELATCGGKAHLRHELFSWARSTPGAAPLSFHRVGSPWPGCQALGDESPRVAVC